MSELIVHGRRRRAGLPGSGSPARCTWFLVSIAVAAAVFGCTRPAGERTAGSQPAVPAEKAREIVDRAVNAIGGRAAIEAAHTLVIEGEGDEYTLGQGRTPDGELPRFRVTGLRREVDFVARRWRQEQALTPAFPASWSGPVKFVWALDGAVAFDVVGDGAARAAVEPDARDRRAERLHFPLAILRAALDPGARLENPRRSDGRDLVDLRTPEDGVFTLAVEASTGLPVAVASMTDSPNLGDIVMETEFAEYRAAGELKLPTLLTSKREGRTVFVVRAAKNLVNAPIRDLAAPASLAAAAGPPPVTVEEVGRGLWLLRGEHHNSLLVEFADHLTLIEAPLDDGHTLPVIERARQLRSEKPLTQVIVTHHHFDHSGGVRAAVAEGLTVVVHEKLKGFVEEAVSRPHSIVPDALARRPRPLSLKTIAGRAVLRDSLRTMELHTVPSDHAEAMLVAYLPSERLLVQVDLYTPPRPGGSAPGVYPHVHRLLELVKSQKLTVERVVPLHRDIVPFADLVAAARKAPEAG